MSRAKAKPAQPPGREPRGSKRAREQSGELHAGVQPARGPFYLCLLLLLVEIAVLATHWPALSAQALSIDDSQYLVNNPLVQNPGGRAAAQFLTEVLEPSTVDGYYQPLPMISLMVDWALGGRPDNLRPIHRTSLTLHLANTALIAVLLYLLFERLWPAALAALLFGLHPLTVEPVAWISERKTMLATFFALLCLICYIRYAKRGGWRTYGAALVACTLALLSKPTTTPLPVLLLVLDYWPLRRRLDRRALLDKVPFFVLAVASGVITFVSQAHTASAALPAEHPMARIPLILCYDTMFYLWKLVWPLNLSSHYPFPKPFTLSQPAVRAGVVGTAVLIAALLASWRRTRAALASWLFFFLAVAPTLGIIGVTNVIAADRYAYFPMLGLLLALAALLKWLWDARAKARTWRAATLAVVLVLAAAEVARARGQYTVWRDSGSLLTHMLRLAPDAPPVQNGYGVYLLGQGQPREAAEYFARALQGAPDYVDAHYNLALALRHQGALPQAIEEYRTALRLRPDYCEARNNLGLLLLKTGQVDAAVAELRRAIQDRPWRYEAHYNLGLALLAQGRPAEAADAFQRAVNLNRYHADSWVKLVNALQQANRPEEAARQAQEARRWGHSVVPGG